ncbi:DMT family transporter [Oscillibacter sp.]|uniref:DMT family transporter n=1 Tax=Oscillibacter sp. TaxID=1945593 RepID=UPI0028A11AB6|nr:DMT family transporter [Oscillibacter sp.]
MERQSDAALAGTPEALPPPSGDILNAPDAPIPDLGEWPSSENCAEYALDERPECTQEEYPECVPEECLEEDSSPSTDALRSDATGSDGQPPDAASSSAPRLTPRLAVGLILLQSLFFGFGDPISKNAFNVVPVFTLLFVRYLLALLTLFVFSGRRIVEGLRRCRVRDWIGSALCIALASVVGNVAITLSAATSVAFLRSLSTVMTPLLALALLRRKYSRRHIPIQLFVVAGLYLLCGQGGLSGFGPGEVLSLLTALLLSGTLVLGQKSLCQVDPLTLSAVQTATAAVLAGACTFFLGGGLSSLSAATPGVWGVVLYLAIPCTVGGFLLQNAALTAVSARTVSLVQSICPVTTALFSFLLLGERLSPVGLLGAGVIVACVAAESLLPEDGPCNP